MKMSQKRTNFTRRTTETRKKKGQLCSDTGIAKSKQLLSKLKTTRSTSRSSCSKGGPRVCGNGMPMPSLVELERMYDDDSDEDKNNTAPATVQNKPERCKTPVQQPLVISEDKLTSPTTLKVIASKMIDLISNLPVSAVGDPPPPPVIPQKKRKKTDIPYIVGCKERLQVPWAPKTSFCKGDAKYGVEVKSESDDEENSCPQKCRKCGKANISKSIFTAKSDEIASWLKQSEQFEEHVVKSQSAEQRKRQASSDSDKTVDYNFGAGSPQNMNRFSPIPSTSRDNDTFLKNDQRFNESLHSSNTNKTTTDSDSEIEIVDDPCPVGKIEPINYMDDDCCVIVEPQLDVSRIDNSVINIDSPNMDTSVINIDSPNVETSIINIDSPNDNGYGSLDFNLNLENDDCEIIDVDDVLAESQAIIAKYQKHEGLDSVTVVEPGRSYVPKSAKNKNSIISEGTVTKPSECRGNNLVEEPANNSSVIAIEDVVNNFFVNSTNGTSNRGTVDLTEFSEIPRNWTTFISSLRPARNDMNSTTASHRKDLPATLSAPAVVHLPVTVNASSANAQVLSHVPLNTNHRTQANRAPQTIPIEALRPVESPPNMSKRLGDCPICMESLGNSPIASTLCGHIFCMECIKASIRTNGKRCPSCRKILKGKDGYHQLFL